nr:MAG TPA: hypothetical protein [Bacteriophage sp.]
MELLQEKILTSINTSIVFRQISVLLLLIIILLKSTMRMLK